MITKPMLAGSLSDISAICFPILATPKLDGIRCLRINGKTVSRKFLPIPNNHIQILMQNLPDGLDGELLIKNGNFNQVQSAVMSEDGEPDFEFHIFDYVKDALNSPYSKRIEDLKSIGESLPSFCKLVLPTLIQNSEDLNKYEQARIAENYEGIMVRAPNGKYKCGRSTEKEGLLLKIKRFNDSEAKIIDFQEQYENTNKAEEDAFGNLKRSQKISGMVGKNTLGRFLVREVGSTPWNGKEFFIGTGEGLTEALRKEIWQNKNLYLGRLITYKYQPHGVKDLPRLPIFKGFRDERDT
jgi:DNA ligase-1